MGDDRNATGRGRRLPIDSYLCRVIGCRGDRSSRHATVTVYDRQQTSQDPIRNQEKGEIQYCSQVSNLRYTNFLG